MQVSHGGVPLAALRGQTFEKFDKHTLPFFECFLFNIFLHTKHPNPFAQLFKSWPPEACFSSCFVVKQFFYFVSRQSLET